MTKWCWITAIDLSMAMIGAERVGTLAVVLGQYSSLAQLDLLAGTGSGIDLHGHGPNKNGLITLAPDLRLCDPQEFTLCCKVSVWTPLMRRLARNLILIKAHD